ncbi:protein of unknown function (DUF1996) [Geosmithia morbida]|uniref:DUF1996 domain-containing protein n=1 Tax=Geosmithia morbida TaxID=1094350 RepID=A0A9P4YPI8_9HYPO|nr:protein of unknown function (DUF1996) [Geosmithia morbida]KAF4120756.1 protein of unknown function (DUF1996) [Geosmithia morbida]
MPVIKSLFAATAGLVVGANAFWRMECPGRSGLGRIDPIISPGEISAHVHAIAGSGAFSMDADTSSLVAGDCTSCRVSQDKSAYWTPAMYFKDASTGKFELVEQVGGMLAYYLLINDNITAYPENFRMVSGNNYRRSYTVGDPNQPDPPKSNWAALGQTNQDDLQQRAIGFNCLNYDLDPEPTLYRHFLPDKAFLDQNCKDGLRLEVMFPSCWDGENVDSEDHQSHVAFPDLIMSGTCPDTHPVQLPAMLFETIWDTHALEGRDGMFVMANGDPTGFGYHGDFLMGWDRDLLQEAVDTCTNESGLIEDCGVFDVVDESTAKECSIQEPATLSFENVLNGLSELPGAVKILFGGSEESDEETASSSEKPSLTYAPGGSPVAETAYSSATSSSSLPGNIFMESASVATTSSSVIAVANVAAVAQPTSSSSSQIAPAPTLAPAVAAEAEPSVSYESTQYITNGDIVSKILWEEEVVWETEFPLSRSRPRPSPLLGEPREYIILEEEV